MASPNLWEKSVAAGASDLHILAGKVPMVRIAGELKQLGTEEISSNAVMALLKTFLTDEQQKRFQETGDLDCSLLLDDGTRFRINCHRAAGQPAIAARIIPSAIPSLESLGLPPIVLDLSRSMDGLILFTGPTGSGKSTSVAAIIDSLLKESAINVITLEDPVEFRLEPHRGLVHQRELGHDFAAFPEALRHVLRQDPDVIMVGEMRDLESIALALTLAETGHLVLATLHTPNTAQSIDRIVDVFPPHQQEQVRMQLSLSLKAVIAQRLLPKKGGGLIANREILVKTPAVANIIREQRLTELESVLQTGGSDGMVSFEKDLKRLVKEGLVEG
jgi:twitching motility protein PilT